jgi:dTDP-L-rhamnose 4-epimerase
VATPRVLITGGAGFIGCAVTRLLLDQGHEVTVADVLHPQVHPRRERPTRLDTRASLVPFDVTDAAAWDALVGLERPDLVVHLAAETGTGQSLREATRHGSVNVVGTTQMLDAFSRAGRIPAHLVVASSRAVYGEGEWKSATGRYSPTVRTHADLAAGRWDPAGPNGEVGRPVPSRADRTRPEPTNIYAATKLAQEHVVRAWGAALGAAVTVLRFQNVYGPGQSLDNPYTGVLSLFARLAATGQVIDVFEDGEILRDFVYIDDVAEAVVLAADKAPSSGYRICDIGWGTPTTILAAARTLAEAAEAPAPEVSGRFRDGDVRAASCDITAARQEFGYGPRTPVADGLANLLQWVRREVAP